MGLCVVCLLAIVSAFAFAWRAASSDALFPRMFAFSSGLAVDKDAGFWEQMVKTQGCKDVEIVPVF
jgi:hypothetical protein